MNWRFISHATGQKTEQNASASERHVEFQAVGCSRNGHFIGQTSKKVEDKLFWPDCRKHPLPAGINNAASSTPFNVSETVWFRMISKVQHFNGTDQHWSTINFCWSVLSGSPNSGDAGPVMSHDVPIQSPASPQHVGARHACQMSPVRLCYQTLNENCAWSFHLAQDCEDLIRPGHKDQLELKHLETSKLPPTLTVDQSLSVKVFDTAHVKVKSWGFISLLFVTVHHLYRYLWIFMMLCTQRYPESILPSHIKM